jgi:glycosyltransferase involved in cell wall biosynthesis
MPYTILYPVTSLGVGGAQQQLLALVRGLDKRRFRPIVAPLNPGGDLAPEFERANGVKLVQLRRMGRFDPITLLKIADVIQRLKVDLVQPFISPAAFFGLVPGLLHPRTATVVSERSGARRFLHGGAGLYQKAEDRLARFGDAGVANSEAGAALLREAGMPEQRVRVIHNGLDQRRLVTDPDQVQCIRRKVGANATDRVVGIVATLTPAKGHDTFLRAASELVHRGSSTKWAIVGDGPLREELESLAVSLGLSDRVTFFGFQRIVSNYLAACDTLVSSSRDYEGHSNSILEAMALGVPVVATDVGGTSELVKDRVTGYLTPVDDIEGLISTIEHALDDHQETARIVEQARSMVEDRFSQDRMVADYQELYEDLIAAKRRTG